MTATNPGWAPPAPASGPSPPPRVVGERIYAPARPPSQITTAACVSAAVLIASVAADRVDLGIAVSVALGAAALISVATPVGEQRFAKIAGAMVALLVAVGLAITGALIGADPELFFLVPVVSAFVLGLDWRRVERLRPLPLWSGLLVFVGVASAEPWTYGAALVWGLLALTTLHLLETDRRAALAHLRPLMSGKARPEARTSDLAATIVLALGVAAVLALVLSAPSCRNRLHPPKNPTSLSPPQGGSGQGGQGQGQGGQGGQGQGGQGRGGQGGRGGSGTGGSFDHTYVPDPNGDFLIPDDGAGGGGGAGTRRVPGPPSSSGQSPGSGSGRSSPGTGADGSTREYRRFADGRDEVTVRDGDGRTRTFTYYPPEADGTRGVVERDGNGQFQRRYTFDPNGRLSTRSSGEPGQGGSGSDPGSTSTPKPETKKKDENKGPSARLIAIILLAVGALALLIWWLVRRSRRPSDPPPPTAPPWAIELARRLDREGRHRGRPRGVHESVVAYAGALGADQMADPRLAGIGRILSRALFSRTEPGDEERQWAESSFDQIVEAHPTQRGSKRTPQSSGVS